MRQQTLASQASFEKFGRKGKRELFLDQMNQVVPWPELLALVEPHYPKAGNGRQPVGLAIMLRTYFLQQWFNLSDPGMEEAFYDSSALRRFAGADLGVAAAPDETTILRFRHLLEQHELCGKMLDTVNLYLDSKGNVSRFRQSLAPQRKRCDPRVGSGTSSSISYDKRARRPGPPEYRRIDFDPKAVL
jgi:IS5 family transposase